jgi:hypothetical protein
MIIDTWGEFLYFALALYGAMRLGGDFQKFVNT